MAQRIGIAFTALGIVITLWALGWFFATAEAGGTENLIQKYGGEEAMSFGIPNAGIVKSIPKLAGILFGGLLLCLFGTILQKEKI